MAMEGSSRRKEKEASRMQSRLTMASQMFMTKMNPPRDEEDLSITDQR